MEAAPTAAIISSGRGETMSMRKAIASTISGRVTFRRGGVHGIASKTPHQMKNVARLNSKKCFTD
jgi:hypothetical protein